MALHNVEELVKAAVEVFDFHALGLSFAVEVGPAGDILWPQPLSLIHSEHFSFRPSLTLPKLLSILLPDG